MHCIIEIQLKHHKNEPERILYYWVDAYSRQIKRGDRFGKLEKTISIAIIEHELEELRGMEEIGVKWQIRDEQSSIEYAQDEGYKQGKIEIAKNMLKENSSIEFISKVTGLSQEEIENLK